MTESFLKKYVPKKLEDFLLKPDIITFLEHLLTTDSLNILINSCMGGGKTTLMNLLVKKYYGNVENKNENIMVINCLKEQGIQYYRNEVKNFCQTTSTIHKKKKILILDDLDGINDQSQQIFRNYIDKYSNNVMFLTTATNTNKINENILSRLFVIKIKTITEDKLKTLYDHIVGKENLKIEKVVKDDIILLSNNSYRSLLNILEKIKIYNNNVTRQNIYSLCSNINYDNYDKYTNYVKENNIESAVKEIIKIYNDGYSVIDIFYFYYNYVKTSAKICEDTKFIIITILCKYISLINNNYEDEIELVLFTNKIIEDLSKFNNINDTTVV